MIPSPSHSILIVRILGFWLFPYKMFFKEDGGIAERLANLLMIMFLCSHKTNMRFLIAAIVSIKFTSLFVSFYRMRLDFVGYVCYYIGYR